MLTPEQRACAAVERLEREYPDAICALQYTKDYELLFATRLSAQCTDKRVNIITKDLYAKFPTLESFALATEGEIESNHPPVPGWATPRRGTFTPPRSICWKYITAKCPAR